MRTMKIKLMLFAASMMLSASHVFGADVTGKVLGYGIYKRAEKEELIKTSKTPSGVTRIPVGTMYITTTTNRIPARLGTAFGLHYEISNLDLKDGETVEITKVTTHPRMKKPDGTVSASFTYVEKDTVKDGKSVAQTGYGFDHDYELVPGLWRIELKHKGKTLITQEFTVYKE